MRHCVKVFAEHMETVLADNDEEKGEQGWLDANCVLEILVERLQEEVEEMKKAYVECQPYSMSKECVDIANFAMMIHSRIKHSLEQEDV